MKICGLGIHNYLKQKTSYQIYDNLIVKRIEPIINFPIYDHQTIYYITDFFKGQIKRNPELFSKFRHTNKGTFQKFNIPELDLELEYLTFEHDAGHKMEYTSGEFHRLTFTKPFYLKEEISFWSGGDYNYSTCCFIEESNKTKEYHLENTDIKIIQEFPGNNEKILVNGSFIMIDGVLPDTQPDCIKKLNIELERI